MINAYKMKLFLEKDNKLNRNLSRPLPTKFNKSSTIMLNREMPDIDSVRYDLLLLTPNGGENISKINFSAQFLTGEYAGLYLRDVQPKIVNLNNGAENAEIIEADLIPVKIAANPDEYAKNFYYFQIGDYESTMIDIIALINYYYNINEKEIISIEDAQKIVEVINQDDEFFPNLFD